jgi:predicted helicase
MRKKLLDDFDLIYILNLHGDAKRPKITKDGKKDENVFDIKQGVAIAIFVKPEKQIAKQIFYQELIGLREEKYKFLESHDVLNVKWIKLRPEEPYWFFVPKKFGEEEKYKKFLSLKEIFTKYNAGIATGKDEVLVDFDKNRLIRKFSARDKALFELLFQNYITTNLIEKWYNEIQTTQIEKQIIPYCYRPFDIRFTIYNSKILQRARKDLMDHLVKPNMALVVTKILSSQSFQHAFMTDGIGDRTFISTRGKEANYYFPLWLYNRKDKNQLSFSAQLESKTSNIRKEIIDLLSSSYKHPVSPKEIFYYIYAVLYSNIYRQKYLEFLKIDFPRIPFTKDYKLFKKLSEIGRQLVELHLLKSDSLNTPSSRFEGNNSGLSLVKKVNYNAKEKRVYINDNQYFTNVEPEIWNYFIGGYQVLNKWLKDRKGKYLTDEEIKTYIKIIEALKQTLILQKEIDEIYPEIEKK